MHTLFEALGTEKDVQLTLGNIPPKAKTLLSCMVLAFVAAMCLLAAL